LVLSLENIPKISVSIDDYKKKLPMLQADIRRLQMKSVERKIPVILCFEGWDAAGKGGVIRRLLSQMDPRFYNVVTISAPTREELNHHYLWRFWKSLGKYETWTIYDRTWYGRVLVERIEGFCSQDDWKRALEYEINDFETSLVNFGSIVIKFWLHISKEEQEKRFTARNDDIFKNWKLTDEDWRNRDKWDQYVTSVNDMLAQTNTKQAPWYIVPGNNKLEARIYVLETIIKEVKRNLKKYHKNEAKMIRL
jgi:polyphosphate kinase 2 (PPK2 family)